LQTHHHLTIQDHDLHTAAASQPFAISNQGLGVGRAALIEDREPEEAAFQPTANSTLISESEREWAGVTRNPRHGMAARPAPYGALEFI
jgi:hypothetical protein